MEENAGAGLREGGTRQRIIEAAIMLFSERSYATVTTRELADHVGIRPASLYSHFPSKEDILRAAYDWYEENLIRARPDVEALLVEAETLPPREVLLHANFHFDPAIQELMDRVISIGVMESRMDTSSDTFIQRTLIGRIRECTGRLLERMVELGRIEPLDISGFIVLLTNFAFSAALRNSSRHPVTREEWYQGSALLYELIRPAGPEAVPAGAGAGAGPSAKEVLS
ncbi:MAG: TetR/AcrR family transcriptional regulator [Treponema sp.]|jgi:AcrR family transcriptional regulator|nr:TetR/AcrR family transcriptional regulator [Treponema sp.]